MAFEDPQYIPELSPSDPPNTDPVAQSASHLRGIKLSIQQSFPNFEGNVTTPKVVSKSEDALNDCAEKSQNESVSGQWSFSARMTWDAAPALAYQVPLESWDAGASTRATLIKRDEWLQVGDVTDGVYTDVRYVVPDVNRHRFYVNGFSSEPFQVAAAAFGGALVKTFDNSEFAKVGYRNPPIRALVGGAYTLAQSDEGQIVHCASGSNVITVDQLEAQTTITIVNRSGNDVLLAQGTAAVEALVGGETLTTSLVVATGSVVTLYWATAGLVLMWGGGITGTA